MKQIMMLWLLLYLRLLLLMLLGWNGGKVLEMGGGYCESHEFVMGMEVMDGDISKNG